MTPVHWSVNVARPLRVEFAGAFYHVISRGNARQAVFFDDSDRRRFLSRLWRIADRLDWDVWAYCLMGNHYHLVIQTAEPNLGRGMHDLNAAYSQAFNRRHSRVGHLFQGRYKAILVERSSYLLELLRYVLLNPVKWGLCAAAEDWPWSSYRSMIGRAPVPRRLAVRSALDMFGVSAREAKSQFIDFVRAGLAEPDPEALRRLVNVHGDESFAALIAKKVITFSPEVTKRERLSLPLAHYFRQTDNRNDAIRLAYASGHYTQAAIARHLGLHYSSVNRIIGNRSFR